MVFDFRGANDRTDYESDESGAVKGNESCNTGGPREGDSAKVASGSSRPRRARVFWISPEEGKKSDPRTTVTGAS